MDAADADLDMEGPTMLSGRGRFRSDADLVPDAGALVIELAFHLTYRPGFSPFTGLDDRLAKDRSMSALPVCTAELANLFDCLIRQPSKNWECDEDGIGAIRDLFCDKEQAALAACAEANLRR